MIDGRDVLVTFLLAAAIGAVLLILPHLQADPAAVLEHYRAMCRADPGICPPSMWQ